MADRLVNQFTLFMGGSSITVVRKPTRSTSAQPAARVGRSTNRKTKHIFVATETDEMFLVSTQKTSSIAQGKKNQVLLSSDRIVGAL